MIKMNQYIKNLVIIALALVLVNCSEDPIDNFERPF